MKKLIRSIVLPINHNLQSYKSKTWIFQKKRAHTDTLHMDTKILRRLINSLSFSLSIIPSFFLSLSHSSLLRYISYRFIRNSECAFIAHNFTTIIIHFVGKKTYQSVIGIINFIDRTLFLGIGNECNWKYWRQLILCKIYFENDSKTNAIYSNIAPEKLRLIYESEVYLLHMVC